ncbi:hypothetical protein, partial [Amycolatopsis thailandensis]|uniref:hypothetical protein n=1 Tax=Amycolatopsis thailandensis TaxID=589330 RepID=UPI00362706EA
MLPFDLNDVVVVTGYFAGGRFAVYDERRDLSYWETPREFGLRLRQDLAAAGGAVRGLLPWRVLLLTDFDSVPDKARREVAWGLGGGELITIDAPTTLFLDQDTKGAPGARIALLPGEEATTAVPVWTSTNAIGSSRPLDGAARRKRSEVARDFTRSGADFVAAVVELRQAYLRLDRTRAMLDGPGNSRSAQVHAEVERRLRQAHDRYASAEKRFDLAGGRLTPLGLAWLAENHGLDAAGITWARREAAILLGRAPTVTGTESRRFREAGQDVWDQAAETLRQGHTAEALAILRAASYTRERSAVAWTSMSQPAPVAWEKMNAETAEALRARARKLVALFTRPPIFLERATDTQQRLWTVHDALVDRIAYRILQTDLGQRSADRRTPEDLARTLIDDLGLPRVHGLAGGTQPAPADPAQTGTSQDTIPRKRLIEWRKGMHGYDTLESYIADDSQLRASFPLDKDQGGRFIYPATKEAVYAWARELRGMENPETGHMITQTEVAEWSGRLLSQHAVSDAWRVGRSKASPELVKRLVEWRKGMHGYDTLESYIIGDGQLRDAFPLAKDASGKFTYPATKEAVYAWARELRGMENPETGQIVTQTEVVEWSGRLLRQHAVSEAWRVGRSKASPELVERLVEWRKGMHGYGTLESYIIGDGQLRDAFLLLKNASGVLIDPGTKEAVYSWARGLQGMVNPETGNRFTQAEVANLSGKLVGENIVSRVWKKDRSKASPELVERLVEWRKGMHGYGTLESYILG